MNIIEIEHLIVVFLSSYIVIQIIRLGLILTILFYLKRRFIR